MEPTDIRKAPIYQTYEEAITAISNFSIKPTILNHSGGGFHVYWVLDEPIPSKDIGIQLSRILIKIYPCNRWRSGTQDISRVLRIPGTYNFKFPENPRQVQAIYMDGPKYIYSDFDSIWTEG